MASLAAILAIDILWLYLPKPRIWIHEDLFHDDEIFCIRIEGKLNVTSTCEISIERISLMASDLIRWKAVSDNVSGRSYCNVITCMDTHRVHIFDSTDDGNVVIQIA